MLQNRKIKQSDYERASQLLGKLFQVESQVTEEISKCMECYGIQEFFEKLETFEFPPDVFQKLYAVRLVLFSIYEDTRVSEKTIKDIDMRGFEDENETKDGDVE